MSLDSKKSKNKIDETLKVTSKPHMKHNESNCNESDKSTGTSSSRTPSQKHYKCKKDKKVKKEKKHKSNPCSDEKGKEARKLLPCQSKVPVDPIKDKENESSHLLQTSLIIDHLDSKNKDKKNTHYRLNNKSERLDSEESNKSSRESSVKIVDEKVHEVVMLSDTEVIIDDSDETLRRRLNASIQNAHLRLLGDLNQNEVVPIDDECITLHSSLSVWAPKDVLIETLKISNTPFQATSFDVSTIPIPEMTLPPTSATHNHIYKKAKKLNLKISEASVALISSGVKVGVSKDNDDERNGEIKIAKNLTDYLDICRGRSSKENVKNGDQNNEYPNFRDRKLVMNLQKTSEKCSRSCYNDASHGNSSNVAGKRLRKKSRSKSKEVFPKIEHRSTKKAKRYSIKRSKSDSRERSSEEFRMRSLSRSRRGSQVRSSGRKKSEGSEKDVCRKTLQGELRSQDELKTNQTSEKLKESRSRDRSRSRTRLKKSREILKSRSQGRSRKSHKRSKSQGRSRKSCERSNSKNKSRKSHKRSKSRGRLQNSHERSRKSCERSISKDRSRKSRKRSRSRGRSKSSCERSKGEGMRSHGRSRKSQEQSRSREKKIRHSTDEEPTCKIDKVKLRQIAIKNALQNATFNIITPTSVKHEDAAVVKSGGKSLEELTEFCKKISEVSTDEIQRFLDGSTQFIDEEEMPFIPARTNKDMKSDPFISTMTQQEKLAHIAQMKSLFPVSSGSDHKERETTNNVNVLNFTGTNSEVKLEAKHEEDGLGSTMDNLVKNSPLPQNESLALKINKSGQFVGSTNEEPLSQIELSRKFSIWAKKGALNAAPPLSGGIGKLLLKKMGWKEGDGLGKYNEGMKVPIKIDIKTDRKGLVAPEEDMDRFKKQALENAMMQHAILKQAMMQQALVRQAFMIRSQLQAASRPLLQMPTPSCVRPLRMPGPPSMDYPINSPGRIDTGAYQSSSADKHPVSILTELCSKCHWDPPEFILLEELGPAHHKMYKFKITLNGVEYISPHGSLQKKTAKMEAAMVCLRGLGNLPQI